MIKALCPDCRWSMDCEDEQDAEDMLALHQLVTMKNAFEKRQPRTNGGTKWLN